MSFALVAAGEAASAVAASEGFLSGVRAHVRGHVIAAGEAAAAEAAAERTLTRVDAQVTRQLVTARETALAAGGRAGKRAMFRRSPALPVGFLDAGVGRGRGF